MSGSTVEISSESSSDLTKAPIRVLSVDDEAGFLKTTKRILEAHGSFQVETATSVDEAMDKIKKETYDAVVSDYKMPGKDGLQFLKELKDCENDVPFILFTGKGREEIAIESLNLGADGYFNKMGDPETVYAELAHGIRQAVERVRSEEALKKSEEEYRSLFVNMFNGYIYCKIVLDEENKPVDYVFLEVNDGLERLTGLIKEDVVGKRFTEVLPGRREAHPELLEIYGRVALTGKSDDFVIEFKPSESWLHISVYSPRKGYFVAISEDITERKKAEKELRKSEKRYRILFESSREGILFSGSDGKILRVNSAAATILGYDNPEELIGIPAVELYLDPKDRELMFKEIMEKGFVENYEMVAKKRDGSPIHVLCSNLTRSDEEGSILQTEVFITDITERKKTENALLESNEMLAKAQEIAHIGSWNWDIETDKVTWSDELFSIHGLDKEKDASSLTVKRIQEMTHPDDVDRVQQSAATALVEGRVHPIEYRIIRPDKTVRVLYGESEPGYDSTHDKPVSMIGIVQDITERKRAEEAIEDLARFPSENPNPVLRIAKDGTILYANAASKSLLQEWKSKVNGSVPDEWLRHVSNVLRLSVGREIEIEYDGRVHSFVLTPLVDGGYVNAYSRDITERKKASRKLETLNEKLEVVGGLTRHDVNNKLATVRANVYLAKQGLVGDNQALEHLREIESAVGQAEQIFDFAKFYEMLGVEELDYMRVEVAVEGACKQFSDLRVRVANDCGGVRVLADSLLNRLFYNLIDNSLKYSLKKSVKIRCYYEETGDNLQLVYEDDGVGILEVEKEKIFEQGYGKGSGLGLYLIKKMCEVYGWTIEEAGVQGEGVRFIMTLPKVNVSEGKPSYIFKK